MRTPALREASPGWRGGPIVPYDPHERRAGQRAREAEVAARMEAARRQVEAARTSVAGARSALSDLTSPAAGPPERCDDCGYLTTAPGHLAECGEPDA